jgi:hypothetical protein
VTTVPKHRPIRSLSRRAGFRTNPPGVKGRPRRHYPPVDNGRVWFPSLIKTFRARRADPATGDGEYAVVRAGDEFTVWQNDTKHGTFSTRKGAFEQAQRFVNGYDRFKCSEERNKRLEEHAEAIEAQHNRLRSLTSEEKRLNGCRLPKPYGPLWQTSEHVLCLPADTQLVWGGKRLRNDVEAWRAEQEMWITIRSLPFGYARVGRDKVPAYAVALFFETFEAAMWFKIRWL